MVFYIKKQQEITPADFLSRIIVHAMIIRLAKLAFEMHSANANIRKPLGIVIRVNNPNKESFS